MSYKVTYSQLRRHLGDTAAERLCRIVWKDGIDLDVIDEGVQGLVDECTKAVENERDSFKAELAALRAQSAQPAAHSSGTDPAEVAR